LLGKPSPVNRARHRRAAARCGADSGTAASHHDREERL